MSQVPSKKYRPVPRRIQQLGGLFLFSLCTGMTCYTWKLAIIDGKFYDEKSVLFSAFAVLAFCMILFPGYKEERMARGEDISNLEGNLNK
jgi:hypothetical protein